MSGKPPVAEPSTAVQAFLRQAAAVPAVAGRRGRLIFALDATASREPAWDAACQIQAEMFQEAGAGGLEIQLVHYGGIGAFAASPWQGDAEALLAAMLAVRCTPGKTQVERVLRHAAAESRIRPVQALVFVGDAFEEDIDRAVIAAGGLALRNLPAFVFHEGGDPVAARAFREIARLSGGAYFPFDQGSAAQLRALLRAAAAFAAGGRKALARHGEVGRLLIGQLGR
ncbi:MAG: hypothetical protein OHK0024_00410 [Thalassobaculales bacterium]